MANTATNPLISVITVVYNGTSEIERTILSVTNQSYSNIEFIIIDGGSTDGTLDVVEKYKNDIDVLVSEPDEGIYDAMNKGLNHSHGDWGIFMNAGDTFAHSNVLNEIFSSFKAPLNINFIVGDTIRKYKSSTFVSKPEFYCDPKIGMGFSHQSVFFRVKYHQQNKFNLDYKLMADFEFFCRSHGYFYMPVPISIFETGGASRIKWKLNVQERWRIFRKFVPAPSLLDTILFSKIILKYLIVTLFLGEENLKRVKKIL